MGMAISVAPMSYPADVVPAEPSACEITIQGQTVLPYDTDYEWGYAKQYDAGDTWLQRRQVTIANDIPCAYVEFVIRHEWMHTAMPAATTDYNGQPLDEVIADCGALMSLQIPGQQPWTAYATSAGGCTPELYAMADRVIQGH